MMTVLEDPRAPESTCRKLTAREVLDMQAGLEQAMAKATSGIWRERMEGYALEELGGRQEWAPSHLHPAERFSDLTPWLESLSGDLRMARSFQVTQEITELAQAIAADSPGLIEFRDEDLPAEAGFMWLDVPVPRVSADDGDKDPLLMHAVSWRRVTRFPVSLPALGGRPARNTTVPAVRIRNWSYTNRLDVEPRPLYMIGQTTTPLNAGVYSRLETHKLIHLLWVIMGMELAARERVEADRAGKRRAAALREKDVTVITLRRRAHKPAHEEPARHIDWSCTWVVQGHYRKAPGGGTFANGKDKTWVRPYLKGPDGMPLRGHDILYRLSR